jgi:hypothetical protein
LSNTPSLALTGASGASGSSHALSTVSGHSTPSTMLTSEQSLIAAELNIPFTMLRTGSPLSLQANYIRYLAYLEACQTFADITKAGTWPPAIKKPTSMDIILLFIGKTMWYDSWSKTFPNISKYPEMVKWLKSEGDRKSDLEVWGEDQNIYYFTDLITWLENGGTLVVKKAKGKEKEKVKGKKLSHKSGSGSGKSGRK